MKLLNKFTLIVFVLININTYCQNRELPFTINIASASDNTYTRSLPATFIATYPENDTINNNFSINWKLTEG